MKKLIYIAIIFAITASAFAHDFRNADWKMSMSQVVKTEKSKRIAIDDNSTLDKNNSLLFASTLAGYDVLVVYDFTKNKLSGGTYIFINIEHSDLNDYITDLGNIKALLIKKYGAPTNDNMNWEDVWYKDNTDKENYGFAVSRGILNYFIAWRLEKTSIYLSLSGKNGEMTFGIMYRCAEFENQTNDSDTDGL